MVLTSLSTYLNSITQENRGDFLGINNGTCPASSVLGGTSLDHTRCTAGAETCS